jgi:hypothetical protein
VRERAERMRMANSSAAALAYQRPKEVGPASEPPGPGTTELDAVEVAAFGKVASFGGEQRKRQHLLKQRQWMYEPLLLPSHCENRSLKVVLAAKDKPSRDPAAQTQRLLQESRLGR